MAQEVVTQLLHYETSQQIWEDAQSLARAHTRSRITFLKIFILLPYENRLEQIDNLSNLTLNPSANIATRGDTRRGRSNSFGGWRGGQINRGARGGRGHGRATKDRIICQVCCKPSHATIHYYHRFNKNYIGQNSNEKKIRKKTKSKITTLMPT
uniref:Retrovirus-related Pol polyprotein from transposon TNT 1-94 n=1 Tax=Cajanus cajan TaxID=3821 RepID=A0A151TSC5_CAJCA|nr:hypothetical protein KK1_009128 [Cajanus cajan]